MGLHRKHLFLFAPLKRRVLCTQICFEVRCFTCGALCWDITNTSLTTSSEMVVQYDNYMALFKIACDQNNAVLIEDGLVQD